MEDHQATGAPGGAEKYQEKKVPPAQPEAGNSNANGASAPDDKHSKGARHLVPAGMQAAREADTDAALAELIPDLCGPVVAVQLKEVEGEVAVSPGHKTCVLDENQLRKMIHLIRPNNFKHVPVVVAMYPPGRSREDLATRRAAGLKKEYAQYELVALYKGKRCLNISLQRICKRLRANPECSLAIIPQLLIWPPPEWYGKGPDDRWPSGDLKTYGTKSNHYRGSVAVFGEFDDPTLSLEEQARLWMEHIGLQPTWMLATGGKSLHQYLGVELGQQLTLAEHERLVRAIGVRLASATGAVVDKGLGSPAHLMRLAGSVHPRTGRRCEFWGKDGPRHTREVLLDLLARLEAANGTIHKSKVRSGVKRPAFGFLNAKQLNEFEARTKGAAMPIAAELVRAKVALACLDAKDYRARDEWMAIGMALHLPGFSRDLEDPAVLAFHEAMYQLFDEWSATDPEAYQDDCDALWASLSRAEDNGRPVVSMGTLIQKAKDSGRYVEPTAAIAEALQVEKDRAQQELNEFRRATPSECAIASAIQERIHAVELKHSQPEAEEVMADICRMVAQRACWAEEVERKPPLKGGSVGTVRDQLKAALGGGAGRLDDLLRAAINEEWAELERLQTVVDEAGSALNRHLGGRERAEREERLKETVDTALGLEALVAAAGEGWDETKKGEKLRVPLFIGELAENLEEQLGDRLRFNDLTMTPEMDRQPLRSCVVESLYVNLSQAGWKISKEYAIDAVLHVAKLHRYHPVVEYLKQVEADDAIEPIDLATFGRDYYGVEDPLQQTFLRKMLLAAVWRAFVPAYPFKSATVLVGAMSLFKSLSFRKLFGDQWFCDNHFEGGLDDLLVLHRHWGYELAEIEGLTSKRDAARVKSLLSTSTDTFRAPYARATEAHPRRSIFVGSSNRRDFLVDEDGNVRFWVVDIEQAIDFQRIERDRDRIWKAAVLAVRADETPYLAKAESDASEERNEGCKAEDPWAQTIGRFLRPTKTEASARAALMENSHGCARKFKVDEEGWVITPFTSSEILETSNVLPEGKSGTSMDNKRMAAVLKRLGYIQSKNQTRRDGCRVRLWYRGQECLEAEGLQ